MSSERLSIIILAVLGIAFVIGIGERLGQPLPQMSGGSAGDSVASFIYLAAIAALFGAWFFNRGADRATMIRSLLMWGGIILIVVLVLTLGMSSNEGNVVGTTI